MGRGSYSLYQPQDEDENLEGAGENKVHRDEIPEGAGENEVHRVAVPTALVSLVQSLVEQYYQKVKQDVDVDQATLIYGLIHMLSHHHEQVRYEALHALVLLGQPAVEPLLAYLDHLSPQNGSALSEQDRVTSMLKGDARALLESGLVGLWQDRVDVGDSREYARQLREGTESE